MTLDLLNETCHYKILGLEPPSDEVEIRKAYKSRALEYHPDKQPADQQDLYKSLFQKIQQAYECLSNARSKSLYDKYRPAAREPEDQEELDVDIGAYFGCCFIGFDPCNPQNFYSVYSRCFADIAKAESIFTQITFPCFGGPDAAWKDVCSFYEFWSNFATARPFAPDTAQLLAHLQNENRATRRYYEQKIKKSQQRTRKKYNEDVRALVQGVKELDPRVQQHLQQEQQRIALEKEKKMQLQMQQLELNKRIREQMAIEEAKRWDELKADREALAQSTQENRAFATSLEGSDEEEQQDTQVTLYKCTPCSKIFKSTSQMQNHLQSKSHLKKLKP